MLKEISVFYTPPLSFLQELIQELNLFTKPPAVVQDTCVVFNYFLIFFLYVVSEMLAHFLLFYIHAR